MSFEWKLFLDLAYDLATSDNDNINQEAALRCAISRAYYAVFCQSRNLLRDVDRIDDTRILRSHRLVINRFRMHKNTTRQRIGVNLQALHVVRKQADYEDLVHELGQKTNAALKLAEVIFIDLGNL